MFLIYYTAVYFSAISCEILFTKLCKPNMFLRRAKWRAGTLFNGEKFGRLYKQQLFYKNDLFNDNIVVLLIIVKVLLCLLA